MIRDPFSVLRPFASVVTTAIFEKSDDIRSDADAARALGTQAAAGLHQVHGREVIVMREPLARTIKADGMITDRSGLVLCIRWADCQNIVVVEPKKRVAGVMHVGWRCLVAGTIPSFFQTLEREWGIRGAETFVAAGPSLCLTCSGFTDPKTELSGIPPELIHGKTADLRGWADKQLADCGVRPQRLERHPGCTRCEPQTYWTYRGGHRDEVKAGHTNMLAVMLR